MVRWVLVARLLHPVWKVVLALAILSFNSVFVTASLNIPACTPQCDSALQVLLHCDAGSSRSGATLVAYLIHRLKQPAGECLAMAQRTRVAVSPNEGFWAQLLSWERRSQNQGRRFLFFQAPNESTAALPLL